MTRLTPFHHRLIRSRLEEGLTFNEIAKRYGVSYKGIMYHFDKIYKILKIHDTGLLYYAYRKYLNVTTDTTFMRSDINPFESNRLQLELNTSNVI